jgi:putative oxidoreductase
MPAFLKPFEGPIYSLLRAITGLMFMQHGLQKIFGLFGGVPAGAMPAPALYTAGGIELVGGALLAVGLFTRWSAFFCSGLMAAAYFMAHAPRGFFPHQTAGNGGELAVLYCWIFLFVAARGGGPWSLDRVLGRK